MPPPILLSSKSFHHLLTTAIRVPIADRPNRLPARLLACPNVRVSKNRCNPTMRLTLPESRPTSPSLPSPINPPSGQSPLPNRRRRQSQLDRVKRRQQLC